jgi:hypothetical protein
MASNKPNPFKVLHLPTDSSNTDIVERGQELSDLAETEEKRMLCRWAMERLLTNPSERLMFEIFEIPGTRYEDDNWERFRRRYRRNPIDLTAIVREFPPPGVKDIDMKELISLFTDGMTHIEKGDVIVALKGSPFRSNKLAPPLEVRDVIFG